MAVADQLHKKMFNFCRNEVSPMHPLALAGKLAIAHPFELSELE